MFTFVSDNLRPILLTGGLLFLILLVPFAMRCAVITTEIRYAKMECGRAESSQEQAHWQKTIRALRWCYIPGLTVERVLAIRAFFHRGRH